MKEITNEQLYAAMVAVLSKLIDVQKKDSGTHRSGGDYSREAVHLIERTMLQLRHS